MYIRPHKDMSISEASENYFSEKEASGALSHSSVHNRKYELKRFGDFCLKHHIEKVVDIDKQILIAYLKSIKVSKSSRVLIIQIISAFMEYLVNEEVISRNIAASIDKPRIYQPATDYLTLAELEIFFQTEALKGQRKVVDRNLLLFSLFTEICLRVSEVINLKISDVRLDSMEVWITRKQQKVKKIPLNESLTDKFRKWYAVRKDFSGSEQDWVFLSTHGKKMNPRQVHYIITYALNRANIVKRKHGPHLLRHTGASLKAQSGENLIMIQYLLGHENLNTTRRYLHFDWNDLRQMVERSVKLEVGSQETED